MGWNISYEFNESDLRICVRQLKLFMDEDITRIDYDALKYLTAECNYGGRVTDDKDRRLISTILSDYYNENTVKDPEYLFCPGEIFRLPMEMQGHEETVEFMRNFPNIAQPEVFGLHANADISKDIGESTLLFDTLLVCGGSGGGDSGGSKLDDLLRQILDSVL